MVKICVDGALAVAVSCACLVVVSGFWLNADQCRLNAPPLNRKDNHAVEHHIGIVYRFPAKQEQDLYRSNENNQIDIQ